MQVVDARGKLCPLPVISVHECAKDLPLGTEVKLLATDPGVREDIPAWCRIWGHSLQGVTETGDQIAIDIVTGDGGG